MNLLTVLMIPSTIALLVIAAGRIHQAVRKDW